MTSSLATVTVLVPPPLSSVAYSNQVYTQNFDSLPDPGGASVNSFNNPLDPGTSTVSPTRWRIRLTSLIRSSQQLRGRLGLVQHHERLVWRGGHAICKADRYHPVWRPRWRSVHRRRD